MSEGTSDDKLGVDGETGNQALKFRAKNAQTTKAAKRVSILFPKDSASPLVDTITETDEADM